MRIPCALLAILALAGCRPSPEASSFDTALAAYVNDDLQAFEVELVKADAGAKAAENVPDFASACTPEAIAARRGILLAKELHSLDRSTVFAMSEEARYVFMSADYSAAQTYLIYSKPDEACGFNLSNHNERYAWVEAYGSRISAWRAAVKAKSPDDYYKRLDAAAEQLANAGVGRFTRI